MDALKEMCEDMDELEGMAKAEIEQARDVMNTSIDAILSKRDKKYEAIRGRLLHKAFLALSSSSDPHGLTNKSQMLKPSTDHKPGKTAAAQRGDVEGAKSDLPRTSKEQEKPEFSLSRDIPLFVVVKRTTQSQEENQSKTDDPTHLYSSPLHEKSLPAVGNNKEVNTTSRAYRSAVNFKTTTAEFKGIDDSSEKTQEGVDKSKVGRGRGSSSTTGAVKTKSKSRSTKRWDLYDTQQLESSEKSHIFDGKADSPGGSGQIKKAATSPTSIEISDDEDAPRESSTTASVRTGGRSQQSVPGPSGGKTTSLKLGGSKKIPAKRKLLNIESMDTSFSMLVCPMELLQDSSRLSRLGIEGVDKKSKISTSMADSDRSTNSQASTHYYETFIADTMEMSNDDSDDDHSSEDEDEFQEDLSDDEDSCADTSIFHPNVCMSSTFDRLVKGRTSKDIPIITKEEFIELEGVSTREWILVRFPRKPEITIFIHKLHFDTILCLLRETCKLLRKQAAKYVAKKEKNLTTQMIKRWRSLRKMFVKLIETVIGKRMCTKRSWGRKASVKNRTPLQPNEWFTLGALLREMNIFGELMKIQDEFPGVYRVPSCGRMNRNFSNYLTEYTYDGNDAPSRVYLVHTKSTAL